MKKLFLFALVSGALLNCLAAQPIAPDYRNPTLTVEQRVNDLLSRLTLEEKITLIGYRSRAVERLDIPAYNWWNEGLHGVARAGKATVFPQAIGMAATFNSPLLQAAASTISTEARAKYNLAVAQNRRLQYMGLTFWSPNINIFRDPRWGRGQETYGEDPYLTGTMGTAFIKGLQGHDTRYLKTSATAKHFAVHSGPEKGRHEFNALVDEKDLRETYLYAFKKLVDADVEAVMCGYNRLNDEPCCTSNTLLRKILKEEWQFKGHIVTDCWALEDIWARHKVMNNSVEVTAAAIKAGINLDCSNMLQDDALKAVEQKYLTAADIDRALAGVLRTQIKLGFYDAPERNPFSGYGADSVSNAYHTHLTRKMAQQSMVLLKNDRQILPLDQRKYGAYMVIGPTAASLDALLGNYHGITDQAVNFVEGITAAVDAGTRIEYDQGCDFADTTHFGGIWAASNADATIAVLGLTPVYEGEEGDAFLAESGGDKSSISLPASQIAFIKALRKGIGDKPLIAVITAGSAVDLAAIDPYVDAIVYAWYPGEQGGTALADILFGKVSPSGRLPLTFYRSLQDLPDYSSYAMKGRTYRYFSGAVQYPFGFGLSYTTFKTDWAKPPAAAIGKKDQIEFEVSVQNTGAFDGDEVVQVYIEYPPLDRMPLKELKGFQRISLKKGASGTLKFSIPVHELEKWDLKEKQWKLYPGDYFICIGKNANEMILKSKIKM